jgi:hypothetical protein
MPLETQQQAPVQTQAPTQPQPQAPDQRVLVLEKLFAQTMQQVQTGQPIEAVIPQLIQQLQGMVQPQGEQRDIQAMLQAGDQPVQ